MNYPNHPGIPSGPSPAGMPQPMSEQQLRDLQKYYSSLAIQQQAAQQAPITPQAVMPLSAEASRSESERQNPALAALQAQSANAEQKLETLVNEYRSRYPDLVEFEDYIATEVNSVIQETLRTQGKLLSEREAIEAGIDRFKKRIVKQADQLSQQVAKPEQTDRAGKDPKTDRLAMTLDVSSSTVQPNKLNPEDLWTMPREKFQALDQLFTRQHYI